MKLWQRYILFRLGKIFFFLLFCLFAVYVLLDLSVHGTRFFGKGETQLFDLLIYYLRNFSLHLDLFLPLAFLLSSLKTLLDLSTHLELVALQAAGLSKKQLLAPLFAFAATLSLASYANHEWIAPNAGLAAASFNNSYSKSKKKLKNQQTVQSVALQDGSELVYQSYEEEALTFFDLFWIRSASDIWTLKTLTLSEPSPTGRFADHLLRDSEGRLTKAEGFATRLFPEMKFDPEEAIARAIPSEHRSISALFRAASLPAAEQPSAKTYLHRKLALPLLPIALLFAIGPFAMAFSRQRRGFLLVSLSLFGFVALITLYESLAILGENRVLAPAIAMWSPLVILFGLPFRRFWRG